VPFAVLAPGGQSETFCYTLLQVHNNFAMCFICYVSESRIYQREERTLQVLKAECSGKYLCLKRTVMYIGYV